MKSFAMRLAVAAAAFSLAATAHAQDYPKRPISMIVPFAAGGTSDVIARVVAEEMTKSLGQPIVIENVAGAGGSTALARAARADADGYTIAIGNAGTSAATYTIYQKLPFTPESFVPIAVVAKTFGIVALRKDFPAKNLQDFIAYAKKNPGKVNLGHAGVGSSNFLICKSFENAAGICAERNYVAWSRQITRLGIGIAEDAYRRRAVESRHAGGRALHRIDSFSHRGSEARSVGLCHHRDAELRKTLARCWNAGYAASEAEHEVHGFRRYLFGGHDKVAFVLPVGVVDDDNEFALADVLDGFFYARKLVRCH